MNRIKLTFLCAVIALLLPVSTLQAEGWGNLKIRFVYDGDDPPKAEFADLNKDQAYCGKFKPVDESLLINAENKGIANVIVYVRTKDVAIHADFEKLVKIPVKMENRGCRFEPHVALLWTKRTLHLSNGDTVGHNTAVSTFFNDPINPLIPPGGVVKKPYPAEERLPAKVTCSIHRWMASWLVIRDNPYAAAADKNGLIEIKNLPVGELEFQVWQEKAGYISKVKVDGTPAEWLRGRTKITIEAGKTKDLGDVLVNATLFKK
jgi:hypothetical protein